MRCGRTKRIAKIITVVYYNYKLVHYGTMFVAPGRQALNRTQTSVCRDGTIYVPLYLRIEWHAHLECKFLFSFTNSENI